MALLKQATRSVMIQRRDLMFCHLSLRERTIVKLTDIAIPESPRCVRGRVESIGPDPNEVVPRRWLVQVREPA